MHGSIWCTVAFTRLIVLTAARSAGVIEPASLPTFFLTSRSSAASSPKSFAAACALQSDAFFFFSVLSAAGGGTGTVGALGTGGGLGTDAVGTACGADCGLSYACRDSMIPHNATLC